MSDKMLFTIWMFGLAFSCMAMNDSERLQSKEPSSQNGTCRQVTYNVQQMYQACPPKGTVIELEKSSTGVQPNQSKIDALEAKVGVLENLYRDVLQRLISSGDISSSEKEVLRNRTHNITMPNEKHPKDCTKLFRMGYRATGVYLLRPAGSPNPTPAFCELAYEGWTILMRRYDGTVDFYRKWTDYQRGFGSPSEEHWLGNDNIHYLTDQGNYQLRVEFTRWSDNKHYYADYNRFKIESAATKYKLHIEGYSGNSGYDGLINHNGSPFSTWDQDNDSDSANCAQSFKGAFWYAQGCHWYSVPTQLRRLQGGSDRMLWGSNTPLKAVMWKIKSI